MNPRERLKFFIIGTLLGIVLVGMIFFNRQQRREVPQVVIYEMLDSASVDFNAHLDLPDPDFRVVFYGREQRRQRELLVGQQLVAHIRMGTGELVRAEWGSSKEEPPTLWRADQLAVFPQLGAKPEDITLGLSRIGYPALSEGPQADGWWLVKVRDPGLGGLVQAERDLLSHPLFLADVRRLPFARPRD
jgi:hypothetical protein